MVKENNETLQAIKKDFFLFRNGIIAESLRKLYKDGVIIFGLNVPQFMEIAKKYPKEKNLAMQLWNDSKCRESRLLALYLLPPDQLNYEEAKDMINQVESSEQAEFLAFRVLRRLSFAKNLLEDLKTNPLEPLPGYCIQMLEKNLSQV